MAPRLPKFSNATPAEAKESLEGYTFLKNSEYQNIKPGYNVKYAVDSVLKGGGIVKTNKFPEFIAVKNKYKQISWCVQLKDPTLQIWVKTPEDEEKEIQEKRKVWELYKAGKLMQITKDVEEMKQIYDLYKTGKLVQKK